MAPERPPSAAPDPAAAPRLVLRGLHVAYPSGRGWTEALRGVSLSLGREKVGIVGESGSGKSTLGRAVMRLLPPRARLEAEAMRFEEVDLLRASERAMRDLRGARMAMVLQDPKHALNPLRTVEAQITEALRLHGVASRAERRERAHAMLEAVRIRDPRRVLGLYPHEVSGGMGQRVMIAMMLAGSPRLVIADEPTSALDVTVRGQILDILHERVEAEGASLLFISHDLTMVGDFCDRVLVMYGGRVLEEIAAADLRRASHPYTRALLGSVPPLDRKVDRLAVPERDPRWLEAAP